MYLSEFLVFFELSIFFVANGRRWLVPKQRVRFCPKFIDGSFFTNAESFRTAAAAIMVDMGLAAAPMGCIALENQLATDWRVSAPTCENIIRTPSSAETKTPRLEYVIYTYNHGFIPLYILYPCFYPKL